LVVLSNNDGCVIARTSEAKDLGIKMGDPWHLINKRPQLKGVHWRSSNYALYGDMSRRMYEVLLDRVPQVEPYSIDEMFMDYHGLGGDLVARSVEIRASVRQIAKIPTCVGIGPTKTIAKLANKIAKKVRNGNGVCDLRSRADRSHYYRTLSLDEVWGLGAASVTKLHRVGAKTVADFVSLAPDAVRELLTVVGLRTHTELRGTVCMPLGSTAASRKSIAVTRSFGTPITHWHEMEQAICAYATRAAEKLRRHGLQATAMQVFMNTNFFNNDPRYSGGRILEIEPTADTFALIGSAVRTARKLWRHGFRYQKAGVVLIDLYRREEMPVPLFPSRDPIKSAKIMRAMDAINAREGRGMIRPATVPASPAWAGRQQRVSPRYTTRLEEILCARS
jgi:DNA polymerase V